MLSILHLVAYGATGLAFCFGIFSLACGLYYLAELVEEYSVYTKKIIKSMTIFVIVLHVLLWIFDRLPFFSLAFSAGCHLVYSLNLRTFPFIRLSSLPFISSCLLVFVDHFIWFKYFTVHYRPFMDIAAFFGLCVWLVPFAYFISLSANDNALPTSGDPTFVDSLPSQQKQGLMKTLLSSLGIKTQESQTMASTPTPTVDYPPAAYPSSSSSSMHYMPPRDIQNRKHA